MEWTRCIRERAYQKAVREGGSGSDGEVKGRGVLEEIR